MKLRMASIGLFLFLGACTTVNPVPATNEPPGRPTVGPEGAGYEHKVGQSRFNVGADARREVEGPYARVVGNRGAIMVDNITGATLAVPTRAFPAIPKGAPIIDPPRPLTENPEEHTAIVRAYLIGAGVPAAQVSGTHVTTTMAGGGPVKEGVQPARSRLLSYSTHLERSVAGIPVEGSFAFAALDSERQVITEGVYWPGIPSDVVQKARELRQRLESENGRASFLARVRAARPEMRETQGEVKIVHTSAGHHGKFEAKAVYTVVVRSPNGGKAQIIRFDETGAVVVMADERPTGTDSVKRQ
jgi:ribosomal protein L14